MIKRYLSIVLLAVLIVLGLSTPVSAHVLKTDGKIGAVLHIDPDDDPIVGQTATFILSFKDEENKFQGPLCNCQLSVKENGSQIFSQALFQSNTGDNLDAIVPYTFPKRDVYQVIVTGTPNQSNAFQPFKLTYDVRVSRSLSANTKGDNNLLLGTFGVVAVIFFAALITMRPKSQNKKPKKTVKTKPTDKEKEEVY